MNYAALSDAELLERYTLQADAQAWDELQRRRETRAIAWPGPEPSDEVLITLFYLRDDDALRRLTERYDRRLHALAYHQLRGRVHDPFTGAEDVVQLVWHQVTRTRDDGLTRWHPPYPVGAWLRCQVLPSRVEDFVRRETRHQGNSLTPPSGPVAVAAPSPAPGSRAALGLDLLALLDAMPADQREVFLLRHLDGLSVEVIVEQKKMSQAAVYRLLREATEQVEALLKS